MRFLQKLLVLGLFSVPLAVAKVAPIDGIAAVVNDNIITKSQLSDQVRQAEAQIRTTGNPVPAHAALEKQVLEQMILTEIQLQSAKRTGIEIDDIALDNAIESIAKQNQMNLSQLREAIQMQGIDYNQYRQNIRQQMTVSQLLQRDLSHDIQVSDQEISQFLVAQAEHGGMSAEYHLGHILIPLPEAPSPEQLHQAQNKAINIITQLRSGTDFAQVAMTESAGDKALAGGDLGWRKLPELPTIFEKIVPALKISEIPDAIRSPSGFHILKLIDKREGRATLPTKTLARHILIKTNSSTSDDDAQKRLAELKHKLDKGEDFAKLAKAYSEDLATSGNGGKMGWVNASMLVPEFNDEMTKLSVNQISAPFKSSFGWHIVQVLERRQDTGDDTTLRQQAKEMIQQRKFEEKSQAWVRQLRDESFVKIQI